MTFIHRFISILAPYSDLIYISNLTLQMQYLIK